MRTIGRVYRKILGYGPKDPRYLASDDLDMRLEVAIWLAERQDERRRQDEGETVSSQGDVSAAFERAVETTGGQGGDALRAALYAELARQADTGQDERARAEAELQALLGSAYTPFDDEDEDE